MAPATDEARMTDADRFRLLFGPYAPSLPLR
jgi:hypothetical protein